MEVKSNSLQKLRILSLNKYALPILLLISCSKKSVPTSVNYHHNTAVIQLDNCFGISNERNKNINRILENFRYNCWPKVERLVLYQEVLSEDKRQAWHATGTWIQANVSLPDPIFEHVLYHERWHNFFSSINVSDKNQFIAIHENIKQYAFWNESELRDMLELNKYEEVYTKYNWIWECPLEVLMENHNEFFAHIYVLNTLYKEQLSKKSRYPNPVHHYINTMDLICNQGNIAGVWD